MPFKMRCKERRDYFQDNDRTDGMGDQISEFQEDALPQLTGSPKQIRFIKKDETNFEVMKKMGFKEKW